MLLLITIDTFKVENIFFYNKRNCYRYLALKFKEMEEKMRKQKKGKQEVAEKAEKENEEHEEESSTENSETITERETAITLEETNQ